MSSQSPSRRDDPLEKTGYRIPRSVVAMVREAVDAGEARSQNELVERALRRELRVIRQRRLWQEYDEASRDPRFVRDMEEAASAWDGTSADGLSEEPH